jgi:hypothetical protein
LYVGGAPLIPFVRLNRIRHAVARGTPFLLRRMQLWAVIFLGLVVETAGQAVGYALGKGETAGQSYEYEFHRERHSGAARTASAE